MRNRWPKVLLDLVIDKDVVSLGAVGVFQRDACAGLLPDNPHR